jgi:hypothetical protein
LKSFEKINFIRRFYKKGKGNDTRVPGHLAPTDPFLAGRVWFQINTAVLKNSSKKKIEVSISDCPSELGFHSR